MMRHFEAHSTSLAHKWQLFEFSYVCYTRCGSQIHVLFRDSRLRVIPTIQWIFLFALEFGDDLLSSHLAQSFLFFQLFLILFVCRSVHFFLKRHESVYFGIEIINKVGCSIDNFFLFQEVFDPPNFLAYLFGLATDPLFGGSIVLYLLILQI